MIDREYLQSLRELHQECRVAEIPESVFDELCRVYLAVHDAPTSILLYDGEYLAAKDLVLDDELTLYGKTVRLVEVK